ncbi:MAG TPA: extracellular solute-binding protein [Polyangia bacterium]|jgi:ABC-type Fe3+ transport system substrate-binding protein|nr:extracellular solute-binding protein [Polyangia bacterium]
MKRQRQSQRQRRSKTPLAVAGLLVVLLLPFVARSRKVATPRATGGHEKLIIITANNESIRYEFGRAFREHMARQGRDVDVDWRSPGGSAEIARTLASEFASSFERHWREDLHRRWTAEIAAGFSQPVPDGATGDVADARRAFLASSATAGVDIVFGGGSPEFVKYAAAGRIVDSGIVRRHPELFGPGGIPAELGGETFWDRDGRWVGACLSSFGICYNRDALARLGITEPPTSWSAVATPIFRGQVALSDPTKSATSGKAIEMIVQKQMADARARAEAAGVSDTAALDDATRRDGWPEAMRLLRRLGANARYFTDQSTKIPLDVASGDSTVGMCIDYYGRFQAEAAAAAGRPGSVGFVTARGETSINPDPIALLRGAPHRELAIAFIEFVLSDDGQKLWSFRQGTPGGPERYTLRRLPIVPHLYDAAFDAYRADPDDKPYEQAHEFVYHRAWTGPLYGAIAFVVRAMCVDPERELRDAYEALARAGFPPEATALFNDVSAVDYATVAGPMRAALQSVDPMDEARWSIRLVSGFRAQYRRVAALAREGR